MPSCFCTNTPKSLDPTKTWLSSSSVSSSVMDSDCCRQRAGVFFIHKIKAFSRQQSGRRLCAALCHFWETLACAPTGPRFLFLVLWMKALPPTSHCGRRLNLNVFCVRPDEWSRPIFGLTSNYKGMTREERQQRDLDQQMPQRRRMRYEQSAVTSCPPPTRRHGMLRFLFITCCLCLQPLILLLFLFSSASLSFFYPPPPQPASEGGEG